MSEQTEKVFYEKMFNLSSFRVYPDWTHFVDLSEPEFASPDNFQTKYTQADPDLSGWYQFVSSQSDLWDSLWDTSIGIGSVLGVEHLLETPLETSCMLFCLVTRNMPSAAVMSF